MTKPSPVYLCAFIGALIVITILFASYFERYSIVGENQIVNGDFSQGLANWKAPSQGISLLTGPDKGAKITTQNTFRSIRIKQNVTLSNAHFLKLSALFKTTDVIQGNRGWNAARLSSVQNRVFPHGKQTSRSVVTTQAGTSNWEKISRVITVWNNTESIDVEFELLRAKGSASISHVSLVEVSENQSYIFSRTCLRICWVLIILLVLWKHIPKSGVVALALLILIAVLITADLKSVLGSYLSTWLTGDSTAQIRLFGTRFASTELIFAAGHLLGFWILTMATLFQTRSLNNSLVLCLYLLAFAACTETVQLLSEDRNASILDGLSDAAGITMGWLVWKFTRHRTNIRK